MLPVIDLHCDTIYRLAHTPDLFFSSADESGTHITSPGLRASGSLLQCFALFTDLCETPETPPLSRLREQYACFRHILSHKDDAPVQIRTAADLSGCLRSKKTGALLTLEEGCLAPAPLSLLPELFSMGVRITTLTWDYSTILGTSAVNAPVPLPCPALAAPFFPAPDAPKGLSPLGFEFLAEAERLGILIDVSHLSDESFRDVASHSKKPFLASHSNARAVCNVPRNLSDAMLKTLANRGGITGLCLHEPFLLPFSGSPEDIATALIAHVKHIRSVAGAEVLALGTDFDGTPGNRFLPNVSQLPRLADLLKKAGLTSGDIERIFYKNALRFLTENLP